MTYGPAILAATLWAGSALVVNRGVDRLPTELGPVGGVLVGLAVSLLTGVLFLGAYVGLTQDNLTSPNLMLAAAGVLTFPVGTGLYYLCGKALRSRFEVAAQSANVKPIFSIVLGVALLHEPIKGPTFIAMGLIVIGAILLVLGASSVRFSAVALALGLGTAAAWAVGEVLMKLALVGPKSVTDTFSALLMGTIPFVAGMAVLAPKTVALAAQRARLRWLLPFFAHGILSFGLGYALYFESIRASGVVVTVLVTAFWPGLALIMQSMDGAIRGARTSYPANVWLGTAILTAGALVQILSAF